MTGRGASPQRAVIEPPGAWPTLGLEELWRGRSVCLVLARRSLMVRYRQTAIGATWAILQPMLLMAVFTVFFGILAGVSSEGVPYPVFVYVGLMIWHVIAKVLTEGTTSLVGDAALLNRVYFPRVYFPAAHAISSLVDLLFGLLALLVLLLVHGMVPGPAVLVVPILVLIGQVSALGLALWLSALNAAYRDVSHMLPFLTQLWFFTSPIIYSSSIVPAELRALYWLNPLSLVIDGCRWAFAGTAAPPPEEWLLGSLVAALVLLSGYLFFRHREPTFSDVV